MASTAVCNIIATGPIVDSGLKVESEFIFYGEPHSLYYNIALLFL